MRNERSIEYRLIKEACERDIFNRIKDPKYLTAERVKWELKKLFSFEIDVVRGQNNIQINWKANGEYESKLYSIEE